MVPQSLGAKEVEDTEPEGSTIGVAPRSLSTPFSDVAYPPSSDVEIATMDVDNSAASKDSVVHLITGSNSTLVIATQNSIMRVSGPQTPNSDIEANPADLPLIYIHAPAMLPKTDSTIMENENVLAWITCVNPLYPHLNMRLRFMILLYQDTEV
jgi:hypothetical protein